MNNQKTGYASQDELYSKYYRTSPARELDIDQTLYSLVKNGNESNMNYKATGYMGANDSYKTLLEKVDALADAYKKIGVKEGDTVGLLLINTPEVAQNLLALSKIGAVSKWLDPSVRPKDLMQYINDDEIKVLVTFAPFIPMIESFINDTDLTNVYAVSPYDSIPNIKKIALKIKDRIESTNESNLILPLDSRYMKFQEFIKSGNPYSLLVPAKYDKEKPTIIINSSGTTGKSKAIIHTDYSFNGIAQKLSYSDLPFAPGNTLLVTVPPWIGYGLNNSLYTSLALGMKAELCPQVDETTVFNNYNNFDVAFAAPLHYRYLLKRLNDIKKMDRPKALVSGGDKFDDAEIKEIEEALLTKGCHAPIINGYGNNEGGGAVCHNPVSNPKPGTIGIPLYHNIIAIFDENNNEIEYGKGISGEICVKTDTAFKEYKNNPEETKITKQTHQDGSEWIHTRDLGHMDEEGYIYITGRLTRVIKRRAFKVYPGTIEEILTSHEGIKECVTIGVKDDKEVEVPMAFIILDEKYLGQEEQIKKELQDLCLLELKEYENPVYYQFVNNLPYTPNNKYDFRKLEEQGNNIINVQNAKKLTL